MNGTTSGKRRGSRRWREVSRDRSLLTPRDAAGNIIPRDDEVGFDFVCRNGHGLLGSFRMSTMDDSDRRVVMLTLEDGTLPEEAGRPDGQAKGVLQCDRCPTNQQYTEARIEEALNAIWAPHSRRVVPRPI